MRTSISTHGKFWLGNGIYPPPLPPFQDPPNLFLNQVLHVNPKDYVDQCANVILYLKFVEVIYVKAPANEETLLTLLNGLPFARTRDIRCGSCFRERKAF